MKLPPVQSNSLEFGEDEKDDDDDNDGADASALSADAGADASASSDAGSDASSGADANCECFSFCSKCKEIRVPVVQGYRYDGQVRTEPPGSEMVINSFKTCTACQPGLVMIPAALKDKTGLCVQFSMKPAIVCGKIGTNAPALPQRLKMVELCAACL